MPNRSAHKNLDRLTSSLTNNSESNDGFRRAGTNPTAFAERRCRLSKVKAKAETERYADLFRDLEAALIREGSKRMPRDEVVRAMEHRRRGPQTLSDAEYFKWLVLIVFYSGFRAETVTDKRPVIIEHFPDYRRVAKYGDADRRRILSDDRMIRHEGKIDACIRNAREFAGVISRNGSFQSWLDSFDAADGGPNLERLVKALGTTFNWFKPTTANHFLTHLGYPTIKPDSVVRRILWRLGLLNDEDDEAGAINVGRAIAHAVGVPVPYVDYVIVCYGQESHHSVGLERGICLAAHPRCEVCGVTYACRYFASQ